MGSSRWGERLLVAATVLYALVLGVIFVSSVGSALNLSWMPIRRAPLGGWIMLVVVVPIALVGCVLVVLAQRRGLGGDGADPDAE